MKFELNEYHRDTPDQELIDDLSRVAKLLQKDTVTMEEYNRFGCFHSTTLTRRFKNWFSCLKKAELKMSRAPLNISDEELFENLENVWITFGKQPSYSQMRDSKISKYSIGTYERRFNGWRNALQAFVGYINTEPEISNVQEDESKNLPSNSEHKSKRDINLRTRFLVLKRDHFTCCICGASPAKEPSVELHVDHIIPWSKGGETVLENLQTLCSKCNLGKSNL